MFFSIKRICIKISVCKKDLQTNTLGADERTCKEPWRRNSDCYRNSSVNRVTKAFTVLLYAKKSTSNFEKRKRLSFLGKVVFFAISGAVDCLVRMRGLEPPRRGHKILSLTRLPVSPHPQKIDGNRH